MKRLLSTLIAIVTLTTTAVAQQNLEIGRLFGGRYSSDPSVSEVMINGEQRFLTSHRLTALATFRGAAKTYAAIAQPLVLADGKGAHARNVRYKDGRLQYAFFALPPKPDNEKENRFIYYLNNGQGDKGSIIVIYIAGEISCARAESIITSLAK